MIFAVWTAVTFLHLKNVGVQPGFENFRTGTESENVTPVTSAARRTHGKPLMSLSSTGEQSGPPTTISSRIKEAGVWASASSYSEKSASSSLGLHCMWYMLNPGTCSDLTQRLLILLATTGVAKRVLLDVCLNLYDKWTQKSDRQSKKTNVDLVHDFVFEKQQMWTWLCHSYGSWNRI